jgi:uncharacterized membrane protein
MREHRKRRKKSHHEETLKRRAKTRKEDGIMADEEIKSEDKLLCALAYPITLISLFLILTDKKNVRFCKYHGWQSLFLGLAAFALGISIGILSMIPYVGCILSMVSGVVGLAWFVLAVIFAIRTYNGEYVVIPFISDFAKKYIETP